MKAITVACAMLLAARSSYGAETPTDPEEKADPPAVTVAVLDYEGRLPGNAQLGSQMADILSVRLSIDGSFEVVERAKLGSILKEHKLNLVGMVDQENAAKVGKLVGARLLVMGKTFMMDKKLMIVTKVVGVETGKLCGTIRAADMSKPLSDTIMHLSEDVAGVIKKQSKRLLPKNTRLTDPVEALRKTLSKKVLPGVAVVIPEIHRQQDVVDPAVETEIKKSLIRCGFKVVDLGRNDLADWAKKMLKEGKEAWPAALDKADYVVVGEAFSEFAARTGDLVTCAARVEINVIDRKTGQIVLADRHTDRAVDLAEVVAGKTALQKAGRRLAVRMLRHFAEKLPEAKAEAEAK